MTDEIMEGQITLADLDMQFTKMSQEPSAQIPAKISEPSSKKPQKLQTKMPMFLDLRAENGVRADAYWETDGVSLGAYMTHNTMEFHKEENAYVYSLISTETQQEEYCLNCSEKPLKVIPSKLSWILEQNPNPKYNLSAKACQGILRRAEKRGKELPKILKDALERQATPLKSEGGSDTYIKSDGSIGTAGKGPLVQTELSGTLGVSQDQTLITVEQQKQIEDFVSGVNAEAKHQQDLIQSDLGVARTLAPGTHASGSHLTKTLVTSSINAGDNQQAVVYGIGSYDSNAMKSDNPHSGIYEADTSRTLDLNGGNPGCNQGGMAVVQGADVYNGELTGEKAATLTAASGASAAHSGPTVVQGFDAYNQASTGDVAMSLRNKAADSDHIPVVCIEGNGQRESHKGDGYKESDTMYTLNTVEQHAVCIEGVDVYNMQSTGDVGRTLTTPSGGLNEHIPVIIENHPADSRVKISEDGICQTLSGRMGTGGGNVPMVMESQEPVVLYNNQNNAGISQNGICNTLPTSAGMGGGYVPMVVEPHTFSDVAATLSAADGSKGVHSQMMKNPEQNFVLENEPIVGSKAQFFMHNPSDGKALSLVSTDYKDPQIVAYGLDRASYNQGQNAQYNFSVDEEKVGTCVAKGPNAVCKAVDCLNGREKDVNGTLAANARKSLNSGNVVRCESVVRRLTPMECERLQGFPDNWTNIGDWVDSKGKTHKGESDAPRYKALGNSIALPFWEWMAERMVKQLKTDRVEHPTMASLFDGIGGFPLVYSRCGCEPIWASEIEEFPIAVTKIRFPEEG